MHANRYRLINTNVIPQCNLKMSNSQNTIKYIKHNKVRIKTDKKRDEVTSVLLDFFDEIEEKPMGMKGFMVMDDLQDSQECIVLTFWERKEDMDSFYKSDNNALSNLVERLKPLFEHLPVRKDYQVSKFKVW
jgi:heme-degrading monooxygenase HmoA